MPHSSTPWWTTDCYAEHYPMPLVLRLYSGPNGTALVRAWPDGRTDPGWGETDFMANYLADKFNERRVLYGYDRGRWAFAIIMRSVSLVAIDIDGKNGGIDAAKKLVLPPTLAETSKSGSGYHLFYKTHEAWDPKLGYGAMHDRIGWEQGVDFRGTGCIYHHDTQRWNDRAPVFLPDHLVDLINARSQKTAATKARINSVLASGDEREVLMLRDKILGRLAKPIDQGKRNNTLFAIGSEMMQAGIEDWQEQLVARAIEVGLDQDEADKLVENICRYTVSATP